ncbi:MAG TPA: GlsB/YeaQ/YmgE family stress response membrane protein [Trueperaceae bacterium]|nr:GlsB/YeaQ/YmgE family stress response membrane protein [Trueperaceae bacterium]
MNILLWIILGALAGWIASVIMGTRGQGVLVDIVLGIVGAFLGGWLFNQFGAQGVTGFNLPSLLVAIVGAIVIIAIARLFRRA